MTLRILIPGKPVTYKRTNTGRGGRKTGRVTRTTPKEERAFRKHVVWCARAAMMQAKQQAPLEGPLRLDVVFYCIDRRWGDLSNYLKCIEDALNGVAYKDDKQIEAEAMAKMLDPQDPRTVLIIRPLREDEEASEVCDPTLMRVVGGPKVKARAS